MGEGKRGSTYVIYFAMVFRPKELQLIKFYFSQLHVCGELGDFGLFVLHMSSLYHKEGGTMKMEALFRLSVEPLS
jgi:hypothetical protein